jgi:hypothetical protein
MKKTHGVVSKSVVALALLGALPAAAGTATYSGSLCSTPVSGFSAPTTFRSGRILNQTASSIEVVCPLQRNVNFSTFAEDMSVSITALDPHLTENVCCTATVTESDGTALASGSACSNWGADTANHKPFSINLASVFAGVNGYLSLRCELPPQYTSGATKYSSVISSIMVTE